MDSLECSYPLAVLASRCCKCSRKASCQSKSLIFSIVYVYYNSCYSCWENIRFCVYLAEKERQNNNNNNNNNNKRRRKKQLCRKAQPVFSCLHIWVWMVFVCTWQSVYVSVLVGWGGGGGVRACVYVCEYGQVKGCACVWSCVCVCVWVRAGKDTDTLIRKPCMCGHPGRILCVSFKAMFS